MVKKIATKVRDTIQLNGKHYDALTGSYIGTAPAGGGTAPTGKHQPSRTVRVSASSHGPRHATSMSGMITEVVHQPLAIQKPHMNTSSGAASGRAGHHAPAHKAAHKPQHAQTLMRRAVKAPQTVRMTAIRPQAPLVNNSKMAATTVVQPKPTVVSINPHRSQRSQDINRSPLVNKFGKHDKHFQTSEFLPVKTAAVALPHTSAQPIRTTPTAQAVQVKMQSQLHSPAKKSTMRTLHEMRRPPALPRQAFASASSPKTTTVHNVGRKVEDRQDNDIFEKALAMATSHEQSPPKRSMIQAGLASRRKRRVRRALSIATSAIVFVGLCGFIAYQNKANIQLQLASAKAGFTVSDPAYKPEGYAMDRITYAPGTAASWYSNSSSAGGTADKDKTFNVIQKKSNWDSQTLLENFVAISNESYQGYQANGRTVYVYGVGRATWVNGGIWYQIQAGNILSSEQLVKVAASM